MSRLNEEGPAHWRMFVAVTDEIESGSAYCRRECSWGEDFEQLQRDAEVGVPLAMELLARFMAYRLTK
jgi:hypothetical protein